MMKTLKIAFAAFFALSLAACTTPQPAADLTPPPNPQVKDPKYDLESGKPRRR